VLGSLAAIPRLGRTPNYAVDHFFAHVAGERFRNSDSSDRQAIIPRCRVGDLLVLEAEPDTPARHQRDPSSSHKGFAAVTFLTRAVISGSTGGRPPVGRPERRVQYSRKRRRCQRRTVSGETMTSACCRPVQTLARPAQNRRSAGGARVGCQSPVDGELLTQGQVLKGELAVAAAEEGEQPEYVQYEGDDEPRFWPAGAGRSITCRADDVPAKDNPR
jgi:hypothetical protein